MNSAECDQKKKNHSYQPVLASCEDWRIQMQWQKLLAVNTPI